jgi:hypothetical protein
MRSWAKTLLIATDGKNGGGRAGRMDDVTLDAQTAVSCCVCVWIQCMILVTSMLSLLYA